MRPKQSKLSASSLESQLTRLGSAIARQRLERNCLQRELAQSAGVSLATLRRLEAGQSVQLGNWLRVLGALGCVDRLEVLLESDDPFVALDEQRRGDQRKRASSLPNRVEEQPWTWGEDR